MPIKYDKKKLNDRHTILLLGPPKAGKSTLASHLFGQENTIVLAYDPDGLKSNPDTDALIIDHKNAWQDSIAAFDMIKKDYKHKTCIVINDITTAGMTFLRNAPQGRDLRRSYGIAIDQLRQLIEKLKFDFSQSVIIEAVDMYIEDENAGVIFTYPNVIGKNTFAQQLPGMLDHVFYVNPPKTKTVIDPKTKKPVKQQLRTILTQSDGLKLAGNRVNTAGQKPILELTEEVSIGSGLDNIEILRNKLLRREAGDE